MDCLWSGKWHVATQSRVHELKREKWLGVSDEKLQNNNISKFNHPIGTAFLYQALKIFHCYILIFIVSNFLWLVPASILWFLWQLQNWKHYEILELELLWIFYEKWWREINKISIENNKRNMKRTQNPQVKRVKTVSIVCLHTMLTVYFLTHITCRSLF